MNIKNFEEKQISSEQFFEGRVLRMFKDVIELPNGRTSTREYARHMGAVGIVPITPDNQVICVKQYRYPIASVVLEIPAGKLDYKGEIPEEAAKRELREETGATSGKLTYIGRYFSAPAIIDECVHLYLAEDLEFGETDLDEDEFVEVVKYPLDELVDMVMSGEIKDSKTQIAVLKLDRLLKKS